MENHFFVVSDSQFLRIAEKTEKYKHCVLAS